MKKFIVCCILALVTTMNPPLIFSLVFSLIITFVLLLITTESFFDEDTIKDILYNITQTDETDERIENLLIMTLLSFLFTTIVLFNLFSHILIR